MRIVCQQTILIKYHTLFVIFIFFLFFFFYVVSYKGKYVHDYWLTACSSLPRKKVWLGELTVPQWP